MSTAINGRLIQTSTKAPYIGVTVEAVNASTGATGGSAATDTQGFYQITSLTDATYFARPLAPGDDWDIQPDVNKIIGGTLAFGSPPPTSATVGTGIWMDNTGIYGLASNVQQFYIKASDGKGYFGAGNAILDSSGITITNDANLTITNAYSAGGSKDVIDINTTVTGTGGTTISGIDIDITKTSGGGTISNLYSITATSVAQSTSAHTVTNLVGVGAAAATNHANATAGQATGVYGVGQSVSGAGTDLVGVRAEISYSAGTWTNSKGLWVIPADGATNDYGIYIDSLGTSATNYAIYSSATAKSYHEGSFGIGIAPTEKLHTSFSTAGTTVRDYLEHTDNTNGASHAQFRVYTGGGSGGDPFIGFGISGVTAYHIGIDNSDSDRLKIGSGEAVGTNTNITLTSTTLGFYGSAPTAKQTVTGSRGGNAALASVLTALATLGLITDSSS